MMGDADTMEWEACDDVVVENARWYAVDTTGPLRYIGHLADAPAPEEFDPSDDGDQTIAVVALAYKKRRGGFLLYHSYSSAGTLRAIKQHKSGLEPSLDALTAPLCAARSRYGLWSQHPSVKASFQQHCGEAAADDARAPPIERTYRAPQNAFASAVGELRERPPDGSDLVVNWGDPASLGDDQRALWDDVQLRVAEQTGTGAAYYLRRIPDVAKFVVAIDNNCEKQLTWRQLIALRPLASQPKIAAVEGLALATCNIQDAGSAGDPKKRLWYFLSFEGLVKVGVGSAKTPSEYKRARRYSGPLKAHANAPGAILNPRFSVLLRRKEPMCATTVEQTNWEAYVGDAVETMLKLVLFEERADESGSGRGFGSVRQNRDPAAKAAAGKIGGNGCNTAGCSCPSAVDCVCNGHEHVKNSSVGGKIGGNGCNTAGCSCPSAVDCVCNGHEHVKNSSVGANGCSTAGCSCPSAVDCVCNGHEHVKNSSVGGNGCNTAGCSCPSAVDCVCNGHEHVKNSSVGGLAEGVPRVLNGRGRSHGTPCRCCGKPPKKDRLCGACLPYHHGHPRMVKGKVVNCAEVKCRAAGYGVGQVPLLDKARCPCGRNNTTGINYNT